MTFSWANVRKYSLETKLRRAKTMTKRPNPDFKLKHGDWVNEFNQTGKYTSLEKQVKKAHENAFNLAMKRREKLHG